MCSLYVQQRAAYAPRNFLEASRPPWFNAGSQQDCSEYLRFLLDRYSNTKTHINPHHYRNCRDMTILCCDIVNYNDKVGSNFHEKWFNMSYG